MNYFKSVLVGLAAAFVICVLVPSLPTVVLVLMSVVKHLTKGGAIAVGPVRWHAPSPSQLLFLFAVFGGGFLWKLRKLGKRQSPPVTDTKDSSIS
jgi:hypothetical protein